MRALKREINGNVVLTSGDSDIRYFCAWGGTPLEFWRRGHRGPITNRYPGSGVSVNWEVGQDPTQATADGPNKNPICRFGAPETSKYNYYTRESLFSETGMYGVSGFAPDFWLGVEDIDNYVPAYSAWKTDHVGTMSFTGNSSMPSGIICPGNEMESGQTFRRYPKGRIAFKTQLIIPPSNSIAGFLFRKSISYPNPTKDEFYHANGYHLLFNSGGSWALLRKFAGVEVPIANGLLKRDLASALRRQGIQVEVRTNNVLPGSIEVLINDSRIALVDDVLPILGEGFGLLAQTSSGTISFAARQVWDLSTSFESLYQSLGDGTFRVSLTIRNIEPREMYRANTPGFFLNNDPAIFPERCCKVSDGSQWVEGEGFHKVSDWKAFFCGDLSGALGIHVSDIRCFVDNELSPEAHILMQRHAINDEFILHINPLPAFRKTLCSSVHAELVLRFSR